MDREKASWGELVMNALAGVLAGIGIVLMALSLSFVFVGTFDGSYEAKMYVCLQAIHTMLIAIGFFLLALVVKP